MSKFATYQKHYLQYSAGHIYLDKEDACIINLCSAASMPQDELDHYGRIMAEALNGEGEDERTGENVFSNTEILDK